jgi:uncharacterized protein YbjT (DUF2867 family)
VIGGRVAERLWNAGYRIRPGSRQGDPAFDWRSPAGWAAVVNGVSATYVTLPADLDVDPEPVLERFLDEAARSGVRRVVFESRRGRSRSHALERVVRSSRMDWTIVRVARLAQSFEEPFLADSIRRGVVEIPASAPAEPFIDADDVAAVAVRLLGGVGEGRLHQLTGPRPITCEEAVSLIGQATGREVRYVHRPVEVSGTRLESPGTTGDSAIRAVDSSTASTVGRSRHATDDVRRILGRAPRDFTEYVRRSAARGTWGSAGGRTTTASAWRRSGTAGGVTRHPR